MGGQANGMPSFSPFQAPAGMVGAGHHMPGLNAPSTLWNVPTPMQRGTRRAMDAFGGGENDEAPAATRTRMGNGKGTTKGKGRGNNVTTEGWWITDNGVDVQEMGLDTAAAVESLYRRVADLERTVYTTLLLGADTPWVIKTTRRAKLRTDMLTKKVEKKERAKIGGPGEWVFAGIMEVLIGHPKTDEVIRELCNSAMTKINDPAEAAAFINKCSMRTTYAGDTALCTFSIRDSRVHEEVKKLMIEDGAVVQHGTAPRGYFERRLEEAQGPMWRRNVQGPRKGEADDEF